ncbi:MAG: L-2-hydroxyglutarate oxidase [bacterium]|nr:L-2-hydroxyglutarate oxidase [bacterium]
MPNYDVVVIGAGLVGLATARALLSARDGLGLCVLEAEEHVATHQSGNNSGVIHSGLYYRPGSLKAETCARGREAMFAYCREKNITHERCGKVVVATDAAQVPALEELERRGRANGLTGIERLGPEGIRDHEPHAAGVEGLFVPETGIADYRAVARGYAGDVTAAGGDVRLRQAAGEIRRESDGFVVATPAGEVRARHLVNCAGVQADRVARRAGLEPGARIIPFRGEYKHLAPGRRKLVRNLIYPVPDARFPFLGVHFTRGTAGEIEAGPNAVLATHRHGYRWRDVSLRDVGTMLAFPGFWRMSARYWRTGFGETWRSLSHGAFTRALQTLLPGLQASDLTPGGAGVRAQAVDPDGSLVDDFRITRGPRAFHVLCAPSPAATASLAIGEHLAREAADHFGFPRERNGAPS